MTARSVLRTSPARTSLLLTALVTLATLACGSTSTSTSPSAAVPPVLPAFDISGTWVGRYEEVGCQSTVCPVCCTARGKGPARISGLRLVLSQNAGTVEGTWAEDVAGFQGRLRGFVRGELRGTGLSIRGGLFPVAADTSLPLPDVLPMALTDFSAQFQDARTFTGGSFALVERDDSGTETMRLFARIASLVKAN